MDGSGRALVWYLLVGLTVLVIASTMAKREMEKDKAYYKSLWKQEKETVGILLDKRAARLKKGLGATDINIEIPCSEAKGIIHQVHYKVVP